MIKKNFWTRKNVFVTGATGLLGSSLVPEICRLGANVICLVRDWVPMSKFLLNQLDKKVNIVRGDVEDFSVIERSLNEYEIDTVFHLAAQTIVSIANTSPISTFRTNIMGTVNVLEASRKLPGIKRILVASSDKAYGEQIKLPYTEKTPLQGTHPYDVSKSCADLISQAYFKTYNTPVCVTRFANFYGAGDLNFNRIIPGTIQSVIFNERPIIRSDGSYVRDYIYIEDAVRCYLLLAEKMEALKLFGEAFNFSQGVRLTVLEITNLILKLMGRRDLKPVILNEVQGEILHQYLSNEKAQKVLGWKPRYTLEEGLKKTIKWYKEFFSKYGSQRPGGAK